MEAYEERYDRFLEDLRILLPRVDPNLANRVMFLERKLANEADKQPHVALNIEYKEGSDMDKKLAEIRQKHSLEAEYTDNHYILTGIGRMRLAQIAEIAKDADIIRITGHASTVIRT